MAIIVLAEDDEAVRPFVKRALEADGHLVHAFENGEEALDFLCQTEKHIDLLLSDIKMPIMDGIELAGSVARILPKLPILLMTGYADQREGAKALQALIIDVIPKPFTLALIRAKVNETLIDNAKRL
jgi:two-component system, cell cycle response regulator CpdR